MTSTAPPDPDELKKRYRWPRSGTSVRLNMAVTADGGFTDGNGSSSGLSFPADRTLLKIIRTGADAIVVGAQTIRAEGWNLPETGLLIVLSRSLDLPWDTCPDQARVRVYSDVATAHSLVEKLATLDVTRILVEGGGSIARLFALGDRLDEVCLTVSSARDLSDDELDHAFERLLGIQVSNFERASRVAVTGIHSVFALWRRALNAPEAGASSLQS